MSLCRTLVAKSLFLGHPRGWVHAAMTKSKGSRRKPPKTAPPATPKQPNGSSKQSRKRSATEAALDSSSPAPPAHPPHPPHSVCQFPPAPLTDFVVHFRSTSFYVHKLVLSHHSAYFRAYIEQLVPGQHAYAKEKCDEHAEISHCFRLPDRCGRERENVKHIRLFLCHLYFARHYSCVPFRHTTDIDLAATPPPEVSFDSPSLTRRRLLDTTSAHCADTSERGVDRVLLSLCNFFDCPLVLSRAEHNLKLVAKQSVSCADEDVAWRSVLSSFHLAVRFELKRVRAACLPLLAKHCILRNRREEELEGLRAQLDRDTAFELAQAALRVAAELIMA